ncbi:transposase, partial [Actinacidiphila oryziradicis]
LHELQAQNRSDQQDPQWQRLYASRSGIEGTMNELVNGHRMRRCRYHGVAKAHVQRVLTAIAVNIERLSTQEPADSTYRPRSPTAFQQYHESRFHARFGTFRAASRSARIGPTPVGTARRACSRAMAVLVRKVKSRPSPACC